MIVRTLGLIVIVRQDKISLYLWAYLSMPLVLFQELGVEASIDFVLLGGIAIRLKLRYQRLEPRRQNYQVAGVGSGGIRVCGPSGYEYRGSSSSGFASIGISKGQLAVENVPRLIIRVMHVKCGGPAPAPFVYAK